MKAIVEELHRAIQHRNERLVGKKTDREGTFEDRAVEMHRKRGADIVRSTVNGNILRTLKMEDQLFIDYFEHNERLIKMKDVFYLEEHHDYRRAFFEEGRLVKDDVYFPTLKEEKLGDHHDYMERKGKGYDQYNRYEAVRYAERWWDDYNPVYRQFTNNCTNFISQCLRAGGAPMTGFSQREKGWWFQGNNWSYSWAVAHAFRWYLSGAKVGLRGIERESASELELGDVICYDFNGDGRWQHSTIVVAFDLNGEPLVNAQTSNSRMRYWAYEDSTAWTPSIRYKFFHIQL